MSTAAVTTLSRRRRILALDGGGVRGAISVAYLERIEALLSAARGGVAVRLADEFDLIGGTSTGAIIATALAIGLSAREIRDFYLELAPKIFRRSRMRLVGFQAKFDARVLEDELRRVIGDMRVDDQRLRTNWAVMTKRMDTGSAWIVGNNPHSRWWDDPPDGAWVGNRRYRVADLVRASAAAPFYFRPQSIQVAEGEPAGLFIDGGLTPHNNPSLALLQWATLPAHGYGWTMGCENLTLLSVGTGVARPRHRAGIGSRWIAGKFAFDALTAMVSDAEEQIVTTMQVLGRSLRPWRINSEIGDLAGHVWPPAPLFDYLRLNVRLERNWLAAELDMTISQAEIARTVRLDAADRIGQLYDIGRRAAETQITPDLITTLFDPTSPPR